MLMQKKSNQETRRDMLEQGKEPILLILQLLCIALMAGFLFYLVHPRSIQVVASTNDIVMVIEQPMREEDVGLEELPTMSPVITIKENMEKIIEENTEELEEVVVLSPVITIKENMTKLEDIVTEIIEPQNLMEDYNQTVYVVNGGGLHKRSIPSTDGDILGIYSYGDEIQCVKQDDGWLYTDDGYFVWEASTSVYDPGTLVSLGSFTLTAYCPCKKCNGKWVGKPTASGTWYESGRTIAVDTRVIPMGSKVMIDGNIYTAEDTGSAIKGKRIDIYMDTHSTALHFGKQKSEVFIIR